MKIVYASGFARQYKKLTREIKLSAEKKEKIFRNNPFDPVFDTHKPHGRLREFWSFSVGYTYRIIFEFGEGNIIYFYSIGDHSLYQ